MKELRQKTKYLVIFQHTLKSHNLIPLSNIKRSTGTLMPIIALNYINCISIILRAKIVFGVFNGFLERINTASLRLWLPTL